MVMNDMDVDLVKYLAKEIGKGINKGDAVKARAAVSLLDAHINNIKKESNEGKGEKALSDRRESDI